MNPTNLLTYLNDHLAGSVAGIALAERCLDNNRKTPLEPFFKRFIAELQDEQNQLKLLIHRLGGSHSALKRIGGFVFEKMSTLKLNRFFVQYSDLSRFMELEGLIIGVNGKLNLWRVLRKHFSKDPKFAALNLNQLYAQAERQITELKEFNLQAAKKAFAES